MYNRSVFAPAESLLQERRVALDIGRIVRDVGNRQQIEKLGKGALRGLDDLVVPLARLRRRNRKCQH